MLLSRSLLSPLFVLWIFLQFVKLKASDSGSLFFLSVFSFSSPLRRWEACTKSSFSRPVWTTSTAATAPCRSDFEWRTCRCTCFLLTSQHHVPLSPSLPPFSCRVWWSPARVTLWLRIPTSAWSRYTTTRRWVRGAGTHYSSCLVSGFIWSSCLFDENRFTDALRGPCGSWKQLLQRKNILIKHFKFTTEMTF